MLVEALDVEDDVAAASETDLKPPSPAMSTSPNPLVALLSSSPVTPVATGKVLAVDVRDRAGQVRESLGERKAPSGPLLFLY